MTILTLPELTQSRTQPTTLNRGGLRAQLHTTLTTHGQRLSALELRPERDHQRPGVTAFAVDVSGSMTGQRAADLRAALISALQHLPPQEMVSVTTFASHAHTVAALQPAGTLTVPPFQTGGGTALYQGVYYAASSLDSPHAPAHPAHLRLVVMTDGHPSLGERRPAMLAQFGQDCASAGMQIHAIGLSGAYDPGALRALTGAGQGQLLHVSHSADLEAALLQLLATTRGNVACDLEIQGAVIGLSDDLNPGPLHIGAQRRTLLLRPEAGQITVTWRNLTGRTFSAHLLVGGGDDRAVQEAAEQAHGARLALRAARIAAQGDPQVGAALIRRYADHLQQRGSAQAGRYDELARLSDQLSTQGTDLTLFLNAEALACSQGLATTAQFSAETVTNS